MSDKTPYLERLQQLHMAKTGTQINQDEALVYFERLIGLVAAITKHVPLSKITFANAEK